LVIAGFAWLCSSARKNINWRVIFWGIVLQLAIALFIFVIPAGSKFFLFINRVVVQILDSATAGTKFVFGRLALPPGSTNEAGETSLGTFLAFQALPTVIFFAALVSALYHLKIMPAVIRGFSYIFTRLMRISGAESLSASSNIFVGVESALVIKPHLKDMTRSELTTVLAAGMGTIASTVLALYVMQLQGQLPTIAGHLVSASLLSAPAALMMAKLIVPESKTPKTLGLDVNPHYEREDNLIAAIINGANSGLRLLGGIITLLIAFLGLLALLDLILGWMGGYVNQILGIQFTWSIRTILGYLFYPFALILGIPPVDALEVGRLLGERTVATEVVAYQHLADYLAAGDLVHSRSAIIASYVRICAYRIPGNICGRRGGPGPGPGEGSFPPGIPCAFSGYPGLLDNGSRGRGFLFNRLRFSAGLTLQANPRPGICGSLGN